MDTISSQVIDLANKHLGEYRIRNGQVVARLCPFCHGGQHEDQETFSVGLYNGAFSCLRGSCNKSGSFRELCAYFGMRPHNEIAMPKMPTRKVYDRPTLDGLAPLTEEIITYFASRKISEETLRAFHVSADTNGNIVFPFLRNGNLIFIKYRRPRAYRKEDGPKEWGFKNGEPILFGMDNVSFNKPLYITEGEIDALSLYEAGITNVVSVPCGCNNLEFVTLCWDWLEKFQQIVLFGDNDEPGIEMVSTLMKRLGEDRCMIAPQYPEAVVDGVSLNRACKDANEILYSYGAEGLKQVADACEPVPIKGVLNLADVQFVDPTTMPRIYSRVPSLDNAIGGFAEGGITVFSGKRGEGKSTLTGQLMLNAIQQGYKTCAYSGELPAFRFLEWIMLQATEAKYIGIRKDERSGKNYAYVAPDVQKRIREWIDGKMFLFDNGFTDAASQQEAVLKVFAFCARRYGCKLFLIDNMMTIVPASDDEVKAQARFVNELKAFAVKFKVHVLLVAHPRKQKQGERFTNDDVSGSSVVTNLADNVINVEKPNLRITKNREFGICDLIECSYNPANRRIFQTAVGDRVVYGWDHTGVAVPEVQANTVQGFEIKTASPNVPY